MAKKKFELLSDGHFHDNNVEFKKGDIIEDDRDLMSMFPNKFKKADVSAKASAGEKRHSAADITKEPPAVIKGRDQKVLKGPMQDDDSHGGSPDEPPPADDPSGIKEATVTLGEASEEVDVTDSFDEAVKNDLTVIHTKDGFTVKDGEKKVNDDPVKTKAAVKKLIIGHLKE